MDDVSININGAQYFFDHNVAAVFKHILEENNSYRDKIAKLEKVATSFRDWFYWTTDFEDLELCSVARQALEMVNDKLKPLDSVIKELGEK